MLSKSKAIVLHHVKYGESSIIATLYTEMHGRLSVMVSGIRSGRAGLPMTFFQPLTLLEVELYYKANREIHRLKEAACPYHYASIPFVIGKSTVAIFMADVLLHTLQEEEGNPPLFGFLCNAFRLFDTLEKNYANFHIRFLLHYAKYLGFAPGDIRTPEDLKQNPELVVFRNLADGESQAIVLLLNTSLTEPDPVKLGHESRAILLDRIMDYYNQHIEGIGRIRSRQVLKQIFME